MGIVEINGLDKKFRNIQALKNLNLKIPKGELFGLIGPDGAGKTTLMRIIAAVLEPSGGRVHVCGNDVIKDPESIKEKIGVVPQMFSLYGDLTVEENMSFYARMYKIQKEEYFDRKQRLLKITRLEPFIKRRAEHLSGGMQKKLMLISSLLHTPELLLLDEPTTGIDPVSRRELWDFLHELYNQGMTIVMSTPYMDEAERCSRIGFLYKGELLLVDDPVKLKKRFLYSILEITGSAARIRNTQFPADLGVNDIYPYGNTLHIVVKKGLEPALEKYLEKMDSSTEIARVEPTFEDVFISLIRKSA
jgi:ABC-2 type transport system ATP-binding protein